MPNESTRMPQIQIAPNSPWYAIYTRHQHEKTVKRALNSKGFETFLPLYGAAHRWKDRTQIVSLPLFPCYVFLRAGTQHFLSVLTTPGVYGVVLSAGKPSPIPAEEIDVIRMATESGATLQPHPLIKRGDLVRVKSGILAGVQGILVRYKNVCRIIMSVNILGKAAAVEVDALLLEKLSNSNTDREIVKCV
jgi:transcription antitermination factor NusG